MALSCCGLAALLMLPVAALAQSQPESRESYLARLRDVCAPGCLPPRETLRSARKRRASETGEIAAILDIREVSREGDSFRLHTMAPVEADYFDMQQFDFGMPQTRSRPLTSVNDIIVAFDEETFADLLDFPQRPREVSAGGEATGPNGDIVVEGERGETAERPTLEALRNLLRGRRIAVRGEPVLTPVFVGARRDFRRKRLTIELGNADDLVMLPRYDENGKPILEGPLAGLAAP
ncbi:MAG: hypothetical protein RIB52_06490 [Erythrobacter sp.]|uniref:hypothetical protein n=1 Tax=Erythrobacter sp. TaxID=1042 RepID=UPI0032EE8190